MFGPRKLPQLEWSLDESLAQFRRASEDFKRTWEQEITVEEKRLSASSPSASTASSEEEPASESKHEPANEAQKEPTGELKTG